MEGPIVQHQGIQVAVRVRKYIDGWDIMKLIKRYYIGQLLKHL